MSKLPHVDAGFFVARTPVLPLSEVRELGALPPDWEGLDEAAARSSLRSAIASGTAHLRSHCADPVFKEALFVASRSLHDGVEEWLTSKDGEDDERLVHSVARYLVRMCSRPTPFGLFAACALGEIGGPGGAPGTERRNPRRKTRLDGAVVRAAARLLRARPDVRERLSYYANGSVYHVAGEIRFIAAREERGQARTYATASRPSTTDREALLSVLATAPSGLPYADLLAGVERSGETPEDATACLDDAIDAGLISPRGFAVLTGRDPLPALLDELETIESTLSDESRCIVDALCAVQRRLTGLDDAGTFGAVETYVACESMLRAAGIDVPPDNLVHVDLFDEAQSALPRDIVADLTGGVQLIYRTGDTIRPPGLEQFRRALEAKFGTELVPLLLALDDDYGVGFPGSVDSAADQAPVVGELLRQPGGGPPVGAATHPHLLRLLMTAVAAGATDIQLTAGDVEKLAKREAGAPPASLHVVATHIDGGAAASDHIVLHAVRASSALNPLGRFADGLPTIKAAIDDLAEREALLHPGRTLAEVVHIPSGRVANVSSRPRLRRAEIPCMAESDAPPEERIALDDLHVCVRENRLVLWSLRRNEEVLPRTANAHFPGSPRNAAAYRFLRLLEYDAAGVETSWSWGGLARATFLPRVSFGRVIVSLAQWTISGAELEAFALPSAFERVRAVRALARRLRMPRFVSYVEADNLLLIDLDSPLSIEAAASIIRRATEVRFREYLPVPGAGSPPYTHEFVLPLIEGEPRRTVSRPVDANERWTGRRALTPGSEWTYAKIFATPAAGEALLLDRVLPAIRELEADGAVSRWFFIRYQEPTDHVRVRIRATSLDLAPRIVQALSGALAPEVERGFCNTWALDTYLPESARYGGSGLLEANEALFFADSVAVTACLEAVRRAKASSMRWPIALASLGMLIRAWGLSDEDALTFCRNASLSTERLVRVTPSTLHETIGRHYRTDRQRVERLLACPQAVDDGDAWRSVVAALDQRTAAFRRVFAPFAERDDPGWHRTRITLLHHHVHMHVNRLFPTAWRLNEYVLYEFLSRSLNSLVARRRSTP